MGVDAHAHSKDMAAGPFPLANQVRGVGKGAGLSGGQPGWVRCRLLKVSRSFLMPRVRLRNKVNEPKYIHISYPIPCTLNNQ